MPSISMTDISSATYAAWEGRCDAPPWRLSRLRAVTQGRAEGVTAPVCPFRDDLHSTGADPVSEFRCGQHRQPPDRPGHTRQSHRETRAVRHPGPRRL